MPPSNTVEIVEVKELEGLTTTSVVLKGGWLQGIVDGEYEVYGPKFTDDMADYKAEGCFWRARIDVSPDDIDEIKSYGTVLFHRGDGPQVNYTVFFRINVTFLLHWQVFAWFVTERVRVCYLRQLQVCETQKLVLKGLIGLKMSLLNR